jgi:formamidopyrimidine-DNA glycosylase
MPELPEVETMRRGVAAVAGSRVVGVERPPSTKRPMRIEPAPPRLGARLRGRRIDAVERRGKRVVLAVEGGDRLVFEPRMTGLILLRDPPTREHLRLRLRLEGGPCDQLLIWDRRGLGTVRLLDADAFERELGPDALGPDALGLPAATLRARLAARRTPIKVALLDQTALAGVGNIYAAEALHRARIHPARPCTSLAPAEWRALARALGDVLDEAIRCRGSTLSDGTYRTAESAEGGFQARHRVYARAGAACAACGGTIERIVQAQRATFFCPGCQE